MKNIIAALGLSSLVVGLAVISCGSDAEKREQRPAGGAGGEGGASGPSSGGSVSNRAGESSMLPLAGSSSDAGADGISGGDAGNGGAAEVGGAAGAAFGGDGGVAGAGGAQDSGAVVTVGADCLAPAVLRRLSPTAAGLPTAGLKLWLRADRGVYATAAHRVCAWVDQSLNDNVLYASGQNRPLWAATSMAAQPAVDFDAASSYLAAGGVLGIGADSARTFIAVARMVQTAGRFAVVQQGQGATAGTYIGIDSNTFQTAGSREGVYFTNNSYDTPLATDTAPRVHVLTISTLVAGTPVLDAIDYRVNGASQTLSRNPGGLGNGKIESFVNANFTLVGGGAHGVIAEAIVYDRALTTPELADVEAALLQRYASE